MIYEPPAPSIFQATEGFHKRLVEEMSSRMQRRTPGLRGSHGRLLHFIDSDGARPSEIAARASITRQAVGQRLREMEELGMVRTTSDPSDGRSIRVHRTPKGQRLLEEGLETMSAIERSLAKEVGDADYAVFRAVLSRLGGR